MSSFSHPADPASDPSVQETQFSQHQHPRPPPPDENNEPSLPSNITQNGQNYGAVSTLQHPSDRDSHPIRSSPYKTPSPRALAPDLLRGLLMVLQAIDHSALSLGAWEHGVARGSEADGQVAKEWNITIAWICRMLTHLCAPGFVFLLGMGVVYFGRSRRKVGWDNKRMAQHFALRGFALAAVNQVFLTLLSGRGNFWILNPILLALAIDYVVAGLIWLGFDTSERWFTGVIAKRPDSKANIEREDDSNDDESQALLENSNNSNEERAATISWHVHNGILFIVTAATLYMNQWLSPDGGRCTSDTFVAFDEKKPSLPPFLGSELGAWFDFWFYPVFDLEHGIMSPFAPLSWISFAFLGILYARLVLSRPSGNKPSEIKVNVFNVLAGILFFLLFVMTRLLHFGNLSEDCLRMPEHTAHPDKNQYLTSFRAFFYVVKYPPSFSYASLTMSANFLLLGIFGAIPVKYASKMQPLLAYGTSALFFYVAHMMLYELLGIPAKALFGHELGRDDPFRGGNEVGVGPAAVYWLTYLLGLAILYPACKWYGGFKAKKPVNSVWRFF